MSYLIGFLILAAAAALVYPNKKARIDALIAKAKAALGSLNVKL